MAAVNWKRIGAGGLLAGVVLMVVRGLAEAVAATEYRLAMERLGLGMPGEEALLMLGPASVVLGIVTVWLYAAIRPRYGGGPRTALILAAAVWYFACLAPNIGMITYQLITPRLFFIASAGDLVGVVAAALAGSWVYREGLEQSRATVTAAGIR